MKHYRYCNPVVSLQCTVYTYCTSFQYTVQLQPTVYHRELNFDNRTIDMEDASEMLMYGFSESAKGHFEFLQSLYGGAQVRPLSQSIQQLRLVLGPELGPADEQ